MPMPNPLSNGPDPSVQDAIGRLNRTELSPLEETMFQAWAKANDIAKPDAPDGGIDLRQIYKQTGGQMQPPGTLKNHIEKSSAIQTIMDAQHAHNQASPIQAMMNANKPAAPLPMNTPPLGWGGTPVGAAASGPLGGPAPGGASGGIPGMGLPTMPPGMGAAGPGLGGAPAPGLPPKPPMTMPGPSGAPPPGGQV